MGRELLPRDVYAEVIGAAVTLLTEDEWRARRHRVPHDESAFKEVLSTCLSSTGWSVQTEVRLDEPARTKRWPEGAWLTRRGGRADILAVRNSSSVLVELKVTDPLGGIGQLLYYGALADFNFLVLAVPILIWSPALSKACAQAGIRCWEFPFFSPPIVLEGESEFSSNPWELDVR